MEKKEVKITVSGVPAAGKSNITYLIKNLLKENGFEVEFEPDVDYGPTEADFDRRVAESNKNAIIALNQRTKIIIEQVQTKRTTYEKNSSSK